MTSNLVYQRTFFADTNGTPLDSGAVYIGTVNQDPQTNPIQCYWDQALTIPATQPLAVTSGYITYNGARKQVWVAQRRYSMRVRNKSGVIIDYVPDNYDNTLDWRTVNPQDYGALANGVNDDRAAIALADATGNVAFPPGSYLVGSNITLSSALTFAAGAKLVIPAGVTVTIAGDVQAPITQIFQCISTGAVVFSKMPPVGYVEWWGAISGSSAGTVPSDNVTAFNAALLACQNVELLSADYFLASVVKHYRPNGRLAGVSSLYDSVNGNRCTRLISTSASADVLQIGPDAYPGSIGLLPQGLKASGLQVQRSVAPSVTSGCNSVRVQYVLEALIEDVRGDDSMNGWVFNGTVSTRVRNCSAKRTTAGTGGTDSWKGFYILGTSGIAAGGNASLYIDHSHADDTRTVKTNSAGFFADGKFTDCFLTKVETVACTVGIEINGNASATNDSGSTDLTIIHPIMDAFATYGIYIHGLGVAGSVEVHAPYCGPASTATSAIQISDNKGGAVYVNGGQMVMTSAPLCTGIRIDALSNKSGAVEIRGTIVAEAGSGGAVAIKNATNCRIMPTIQNDSTTGGPAVQVIDTCTANIIAPIVKGKASGSTFGIQVTGTTDARNEYNCSGIDSGTIAGGSGNKLVRNAVQITTTGLSGTNLVSGVMT